jgi:hypothetical protein
LLRQDVGVTDVPVEARIVPANEASWDDLDAVLGAPAVMGDAADARWAR